MRYLHIDKVVPGSYLARPLYNAQGAIMLRERYELTECIIKRLKEYGFTGLYIEDKISEGITIDDIIDEQLKVEAKIKLETIIKNNGNIKDMLPTISNIVDCIMENKDAVIQISQLRNYHDYTYSHCVNVGILAISIGLKYNYNRNDLIKLGAAGMLHDIGKNDIPVEILDKPGKLTREEFELIKNHPLYGYNMLKDSVELSSLTKVGVLQHHERCDGTGYPNGLKGDEISMFGKIIAVADTYDAMTSMRSYRPAFSSVEAYEFLIGDGNTRYDLSIVEKFTKCIAVYPVGTCVKLTDGTKAIVVKNYSDNPLRPLLRNIETNEMIDLQNDGKYLNICVKEVIE